MGKSTNGLGVFRGKVGSVVFQANKGDTTANQIVKAYQPIVANPRTDGQLAQRAKMTLAGQLSSICPSDVLSAFGMTKRNNRGKFVSTIISASTTNRVSGNYIANVDASDIQFSKGGFANPFTLTPRIGINSSVLSVAISCADTVVGRYGVRVIAMLVHTVDGSLKYDDVVYKDIIPNATDAAVSLDLSAAVISDEVQNCYVYAVPFRITDRANVNADFIVSEGTTITSGLNRSVSTSGYEFGRTDYCGVSAIVNTHTFQLQTTSSGNMPASILIDGVEAPRDVNNRVNIELTPGQHSIAISGAPNLTSPCKISYEESDETFNLAIVLTDGTPVNFTMPNSNVSAVITDVEYHVTARAGELSGSAIVSTDKGSVEADPVQVPAGQTTVLTATPTSGNRFVGWYTDAQTRISTSATYTYQPSGTATIYGVFAEQSGGGGQEGD